jgi:putative ABC transport system substrate-binding protein
MKRKIIGFALCSMLLAPCSAVDAQQPTKMPRIGYVSPTGDPKTPGPQVEGFRQGLRDLGYIEEKNIVVEYRYIEGKPDSVPSLAAELVEHKVDVLWTSTSDPCSQAGDQDDPYCHGDNSRSRRSGIYR